MLPNLEEGECKYLPFSLNGCHTYLDETSELSITYWWIDSLWVGRASSTDVWSDVSGVGGWLSPVTY